MTLLLKRRRAYGRVSTIDHTFALQRGALKPAG
jgi:hypothetical protein